MSAIQDYRLKKEKENGPIGCLENAIKNAQFNLDASYEQKKCVEKEIEAWSYIIKQHRDAINLICESLATIKQEKNHG